MRHAFAGHDWGVSGIQTAGGKVATDNVSLHRQRTSSERRKAGEPKSWLSCTSHVMQKQLENDGYEAQG
jgi:hypothetical protein